MTIEEAKDFGRRFYSLTQRDLFVAHQLEIDFSLLLAKEPDDDVALVLYDAYLAGQDEAKVCDFGGVL